MPLVYKGDAHKTLLPSPQAHEGKIGARGKMFYGKPSA